MFNRKNRMAALMSMAKTPVLSQEDNADAPQPASEPAQKDVVEAPLTNDKGLETEKSTDGSGETMAPGQDTEETKRTDVGSGAKELAPDAELTSPTEKQPDFNVEAPVLNPAADPNNPTGGDTKPQVAEPAANVGDADKSETQTENTEGGEKVGEDANKPKNAEGTTDGKPGAEGESEGKVSEESEAAEIAAAAIEAYEKGVARGEGTAATGGEAPAEQVTPEAAAEQAAATVAQAAADAAQASAADIAAGGTGEVTTGGTAAEADIADAIDGAVSAGVDGAAEAAAVDGTLDNAAAAGELPADTTGAAEAALDDAAGNIDDTPTDGSTEGVSGDDATTAGEGDSTTEGEGASEGEPTQTSETEGDSTSEVETEEAKRKAAAEDDALDDLDDLEDEEELALEQYNIASDMLTGIRMLAQESYQSEHGGLTPDVVRALGIALEGAQCIGSIRATEGLSLEALDYRLPAHITDDLMYSIEEMEEQLGENTQLSQESILDVFRSRTTIFKNTIKDYEQRVSKLRQKLKGRTDTVSVVTCKATSLDKYLSEMAADIDGVIKTLNGNSAAVSKLKLAFDTLANGSSDIQDSLDKIHAVKLELPKIDPKEGITGLIHKGIVATREDGVVHYDYTTVPVDFERTEFELSKSTSIFNSLNSLIGNMRQLVDANEKAEKAAAQADVGISNSRGSKFVGVVTGLLTVASLGSTIPLFAIWGAYATWFSRKSEVRKDEDLLNTVEQLREFSELVKCLQKYLDDNIGAIIKTMEDF